MKPKHYAAIALLCSTLYYNNSSAQANTKLSNLASPTAVNLNLLPGANNTLNLGNGGFGWKSIYLGSNLYLKNVLTMQAPGTTNFFIGPASGNAASTAVYNTGLGYNTLGLATSGGYNTALGHTAMRSNTTGSKNTAIGYVTLYNNTSGSYNTANGERSLYKNTMGSYNTSSGEASMYNNTIGTSNSAYGYRALFANTTGESNTSAGYQALHSNTSGSYNAAFGENALYSATTGSYNVAVGPSALRSNTGNYNVGNGYVTLYSNTANYNTATGAYALSKNTTGTTNNASGYGALYLNTTGSFNTGLGAYALYNGGTGIGNTAIGYSADVSNATFSNTTALGYGALATASNQVMLGNSSVTSVKAAASVVIYSDGRYKRDVQDNVPGLAFIKQLRPVTYRYDMKGMHTHISATANGKKNNASMSGNGPDMNADDERLEQEKAAAIAAKEKIVYTGFIAQEVEALAKKLRYDFNGIYKPQNEKDLYGLSYESFVVPLVKAIQELALQNEKLTLQNDSIQATYEDLFKKIDKLEALLTGKSTSHTVLSNASLGQNKPNPFNNNTSIGYSLPPSYNAAQVVVYNTVGTTLKQINLSAKGSGLVQLDASTLPAGTYHYSLFVDGKIVDTKKMVLIK